MLTGIVASYAQENTGASPYLNSQHAYRVPIGLVANTQEWEVTDKGANTFNVTNSPETWATITSATSDGAYDVIQLFFDRNVFSTGTWYLQFYEYQDMGGSVICTAAREFPITIVENTFYLTLAADVATQCNSQSGEIHALTELDEATEVFDTDVSYTVSMTKTATFDPTTWDFDANFSQSVSAISATSTDGAVSITGATPGTDFNLEVTPVANTDAVDVTITVTYSNTVLANVTNNITVTNGEAIVTNPPIPDAITEDNIITYVDGAPNRVQAITILGLPNTADIAPGAGETVYTATHPNLLSAHKYVVVMDDVGNTKSWWIENAAGDVTLTPVTQYTIVTNLSATADTATIDFIDETVTTGNYFIYFKETDATTGCSTIRPYAIEILPPFDVEIAAAGDQCAQSSIDETIYTDVTSGTTTIGYVVDLITFGYTDGWEFDVEVTTTNAGGWSGTDVDVAIAGISVSAGGTYTVGGDKYNGHVDVAGGTAQVTVSITYTGYYITNYPIKVSLTGITGSFGEDDVDGEGNNSTTHNLYQLPQPEAIAGVD